MGSRFGGDESHRILRLLTLDVQADPQAQKELNEAKTALAAINATVDKQRALMDEVNKRIKAQTKIIVDQKSSREMIAAAERELGGLQEVKIEREARLSAELGKQAQQHRTIVALMGSEAEKDNLRLVAQQKLSRQTELQGLQARFFGDVESRARALTGAVGYLGGGGIERQANIANEVLASVEAIGLLKIELPQMRKAAIEWAGGVQPLIGYLGAAAAATILMVTALKLFDRASKEVKQGITNFISENEAYASAIGKTTEEVKKDLEANEDRLESLRAERTRIREAEQALGDLGGAEGALIDVARVLEELPLGASFGLEELEKRGKELDDQINELKSSQRGLNAAIQAGVTAEADLAEIMRQREKDLLDAAEDEARLSDFYIDLNDELEGMTWDEYVQKQKELTLEYDKASARVGILKDKVVELNEALPAEEGFNKAADALNSMFGDTAVTGAPAGPTTTDQQRRFGEYIAIADEAAGRTGALTAAMENLVDGPLRDALTAAERERQAAADRINILDGWGIQARVIFNTFKEDATSAAQDAAKAFLEGAQRLAAFGEAAQQHQDALALMEEDRLKQVARAQQDFALAVANAYADLYVDLARLDQDFAEKQAELVEKEKDQADDARKKELDALAKHLKEMARLAEDHARKIRDIQREMNAGVAEAVEERDVSAAIEAIRRGREEIRAENENYEIEKKRREEDFKERQDEMEKMREEKRKDFQKQLQDLKDAHARQRQERIADFNRRLQQMQSEFALRQQRENQDYQERRQRMIDAFKEQYNLTDTHYQNLSTLTETALQGIEDQYGLHWQRLLDNMVPPDIADIADQVIHMPDIPGLSFADGGYPPTGVPVRVGERGPEWVQFASPARVYPFGQSPNISNRFDMSGMRAHDAAYIERVFESRVIPKFITALRQVNHRRV